MTYPIEKPLTHGLLRVSTELLTCTIHRPKRTVQSGRESSCAVCLTVQNERPLQRPSFQALTPIMPASLIADQVDRLLWTPPA
jgi:hypothetical protein